MQKRFLGYIFVNRNKKDILVETEGLLSDVENRCNNKKMSWIVKEAFSGRYNPCDELKEYTSFTKLSSLLNFSREKFYKTISLSLAETLNSKYPSIRLSNEEIFTLFIGDRILKEELVENGDVPVYSANVRKIFGYIDKQNVTDFKIPSILWGIDGEWIINYIPAGTVFYPTDHCGVLRIKTNELNPYYVSMAVNIVGESYHFSRSNRASIDRVKDIEIPIPPKKIQDEIAKECASIDSEYNSSRMTMEEYRYRIKKSFTDYQIFMKI
jgi:restriction endonuclease S subunit